MEAKKKELTIAELEKMRANGNASIDSSEVIAQKRAERARKKEEKAKKEEEERAEKAVQASISHYFSNSRKTKDFLAKLGEEIRNQRKAWLSEGITEATLPENLKKPYYLAFERLDYNHYRKVMGPLAIEGLKIQDKEMKIFTFNFVDKLLSDGFVDMGWIISMLNKKYVSRYGWALLRKHAKTLGDPGGNLIGGILDEWADDHDTWVKWEKLAAQDGLPVDTRELYPRTWNKKS